MIVIWFHKSCVKKLLPGTFTIWTVYQIIWTSLRRCGIYFQTTTLDERGADTDILIQIWLTHFYFEGGAVFNLLLHFYNISKFNISSFIYWRFVQTYRIKWLIRWPFFLLRVFKSCHRLRPRQRRQMSKFWGWPTCSIRSLGRHRLFFN